MRVRWDRKAKKLAKELGVDIDPYGRETPVTRGLVAYPPEVIQERKVIGLGRLRVFFDWHECYDYLCLVRGDLFMHEVGISPRLAIDLVWGPRINPLAQKWFEDAYNGIRDATPGLVLADWMEENGQEGHLEIREACRAWLAKEGKAKNKPK